MARPTCTCGKTDHELSCPEHPRALALFDALRAAEQGAAVGLEQATASALIHNRLAEYLEASRPTDTELQQATQVIRAAFDSGMTMWSPGSGETPAQARERFERALLVLLRRCR